MNHIIEFDEQCKPCKGTGLYVGMAEYDGAAVVCHTCKGTGLHHVKIEYNDFTGRKERLNIKRVFETNPGIGVGEGKQRFSLSDFGGMPYKEWLQGLPFPKKSEMRKFTCPAWWYQSADYDLKPNWDKCGWGGSFSGCKHFHEKDKCWEQWDCTA